jgi:hypothetical protein
MGFVAALAAADRAALTHLGGPVTYTPGGGPAVEVTGVFDAVYQRVEAGNPGVTSSGPAVFLRLADLPSDPEVDEDATVTVDGTTYTVSEPRPDGQGGVLLQLFKAT